MSTPANQVIRNAVATYANLLTQWGIDITPDVQSFIIHAVKSGWTSSYFIRQARLQRWYAQRFLGIMRPNGTMRMTEAQYIAGYNSARDYAASIGRNLSPHAYGLAVKNGNSPSEIRDKMQAVDVLRENRETFQAFFDYLVETGRARPKDVTRGALLQTIMGMGPKEWEDTWTRSYVAAQLENASITVGKGQEISWKGLKRLIAHAGPGVDVTSLNWREVGQLVREVLPQAVLYQENITKKDLAAMELGGKRAPQILAQIQRVAGTYAARFQPEAQMPFVQGPRGTQILTGGLAGQQATE